LSLIRISCAICGSVMQPSYVHLGGVSSTWKKPPVAPSAELVRRSDRLLQSLLRDMDCEAAVVIRRRSTHVIGDRRGLNALHKKVGYRTALAFADHVPQLDAGQGPWRGLKRFEAQPRAGEALDILMVLLHYLIEREHLTLVERCFKLGAIPHHSTVDGRITNRDTPLPHEFFSMTIAQGIGQRPPHAGRDDGRHEVGGLEVRYDSTPSHDSVSHRGKSYLGRPARESVRHVPRESPEATRELWNSKTTTRSLA
jgi:hypothetical protein